MSPAALHRPVEVRVLNTASGISLIHPLVDPLDDDLEVYAFVPSIRHDLERDRAVGSFGEPQRTDEGHLRAATWAFALNRPSPQVGDWCGSVRVLGIVPSQLLLGLV